MIIVEPEIGEMVQTIGELFKDDNHNNVYCYKVIKNIISDKNNNEYLIDNKWFPIYRIYQFSFGGIEMYNDKYNHGKITKENWAYIKAHGGDPSGVYIWAI